MGTDTSIIEDMLQHRKLGAIIQMTRVNTTSVAERSKVQLVLKVVVSNPARDKYFHFDFFACFPFLVPRRNPYI